MTENKSDETVTLQDQSDDSVHPQNEVDELAGRQTKADEPAETGNPAEAGETGTLHKHNLGFIQRDYINPNNLGFIRVVLCALALTIIFSIIGVAVIMKDMFVFDLENTVTYLNVILCAVSFWLLWRRKKVARLWMIGFLIYSITIGAVVNVMSGTFSIGAQLSTSSIDIILLLYFIFAKRPKIVLNRTFSLETYRREAEEDSNCFRPKTWPFWRNLIIYFCVFSVVGHWMEAAYCTLIRFGILPGIYDPNSQIWSDWLYPFLVYGFGVVACILIFYPLKIFLQKRITGGWKANFINVFITFVVSGIVCCLIELVMGLTMNMDYSLWDYRTMFCNFMGQICLQNGIAFGMIATLMTWVIYPALERMMSRLPKEIGNGIFIGVVVGFTFLWLLYCFQPPKEVADIRDEAIIEQQQLEQQGEKYKDMAKQEVLELAEKKSNESKDYYEQGAAQLKAGNEAEAENYFEKARTAQAEGIDALDYYIKMENRTVGIYYSDQ